MTLSEAIQHCKEKVAELEELVDKIGISPYDDFDCEECAKEHRQLADWLKELESYRNMDRREYYKVYTDKIMECGYGEFNSVDRARASTDRGVIVRVIELKEIVEEI